MKNMVNELTKVLAAKGYEVEVTEITKNGVKMTSLVFGTGNIRPNIYPEYYYEAYKSGESLDSIADKMIKAYESHKNPDFEIKEVISPDFIKNHVRICLQRITDEPVIKRNSKHDGLEAYLRVIEKGYSFKVNASTLATLNMSESELWELAEKNTLADVKIVNMADALPFPLELPMWVVSNSYNMYGSGAIEVITKEYVNKYIGGDVVILPSSIHECIFVSADTGNTADLIGMVKEVNATAVDPKDQLADKVFTL